jgi:hypothetical protein
MLKIFYSGELGIQSIDIKDKCPHNAGWKKGE